MIIATGTNTIHKTATSVALNYGNFLTDDLLQELVQEFHNNYKASKNNNSSNC